MEAEIFTPSLILRLAALITTVPLFPVAPGKTSTKMKLSPPVASINSEVLIVKFPAFPSPKVEAEMSAPSLILRLAVLIATVPPFPVASGPT